jgi:glutathione synthase
MAFELTEDQAIVLAREGVHLAACNGLLMGAPTSITGVGPDAKTLFIHCPFTLLPSPIPQHCFQDAIDLAPLFGKLVHRISLDYEWLTHTLDKYAKSPMLLLNSNTN